ncbi:hypothetical protein M885DRAFT_618858 [Pelagophyceae sp. CCMP2097]|nr:hypothetical protein M885DRAFT_618858 [Pelagophyceae sp. CCMP2097]
MGALQLRPRVLLGLAAGAGVGALRLGRPAAAVYRQARGVFAGPAGGGRRRELKRRASPLAAVPIEREVLAADGGASPAALALLELGLRQLRKGDEVGASTSLRQAAGLEPKDERCLKALRLVGDALAHRKKFEAALDCYQLSVSLEPEDAAVGERYAKTLSFLGRIPEGAEALYETVKRLPQDDGALGWLYFDLGVMIESLEPPPGTAAEWATGELSAGVELCGVDVTAEECYRSALFHQPDLGEAQKALADYIVATRGASAARPYYEAALELVPNDVSAATHALYGEGRPTARAALALPPAEAGDDVLDAALADGALLTAADLESLREPTVASLSVFPDEGSWDVTTAAAIFERHGVVVLPNFIGHSERKVLRKATDTKSGDAEVIVDFTAETRAYDHRVHRALSLGRPGDGVTEALDDVTRRLWPLFAAVLQAGPEEKLPLIGAGFMVVSPGADAQELHKDVHGHDRHACDACPAPGDARAISVQIQLTDTTAAQDMGSFEILPGSHRPDAASGLPDDINEAVAACAELDGAAPAADYVRTVAVPPGTVTIYSRPSASRAWHRGGANRSDKTRTFVFLTLMEPDSPAPPGLIHTMMREDVGRWTVNSSGLARGKLPSLAAAA